MHLGWGDAVKGNVHGLLWSSCMTEPLELPAMHKKESRQMSMSRFGRNCNGL